MCLMLNLNVFSVYFQRVVFFVTKEILLWRRKKCYFGEKNTTLEKKILLWRKKCYCGEENAVLTKKSRLWRIL